MIREELSKAVCRLGQSKQNTNEKEKREMKEMRQNKEIIVVITEDKYFSDTCLLARRLISQRRKKKFD